MLKPDPTTTNYILYLLVPSFASSLGCRGRELGGMINMYTTYYYTMLQQLLLHCYLYCFIELLVVFFSHAARHRRKMLVFDRPSIFHLILVFSILQSTIQPPHFHLIHAYKLSSWT